MELYRVCSGQARRKGGNNWGICLADRFYPACPWWRHETSDGRRQMTYATFEAAERARLRLAKAPMPESLRASLEKNRGARANNPAKVAVVPYGGPYFTNACPACGVENRSRLRDAFLTGDN